MNSIKELRERLSLSQSELAQILGKSVQSIQSYERSTVPAEIARRLVELAREHHLEDSARKIERDYDVPGHSGDEPSLGDLTYDETQFLLGCLGLYRDKSNSFGQRMVEMIKSFIKLAPQLRDPSNNPIQGH